MKKIVVPLFAFFCSWMPLRAQITVESADMPSQGDTMRVSVTNIVPAGYNKTAMDTIWNFMDMEPMTQRVDSFVSPAATPAAYQLVFMILGGSNLASPKSGSPIPGLSINHGFTFYKNGPGSFSELGSAYTVQGIPVPAKYDNPDEYYAFPMTPGSAWSSVSSFAFPVPGLLYFSTRRYRTSIVDGWGTLTTPYGTFPVLRVKSTILEHDSLYIDSLSTGFPITRNMVEYKWLGKDQGIPLMQVSEEGSLVTATYRDSTRMSAVPLTVSLGADTAVFKGDTVTLHAVVSGGTPPYSIFWNTLDTGSALTVAIQDTRTITAIVIDAMQNIASDQVTLSVKYHPGIGETGAENGTVYPDPACGQLHVRLPGKERAAKIQVFSLPGRKICEKNGYGENGEMVLDISDLPDGLYFLRVLQNHRTGTYRFMVAK